MIPWAYCGCGFHPSLGVLAFCFARANYSIFGEPSLILRLFGFG